MVEYGQVKEETASSPDSFVLDNSKVKKSHKSGAPRGNTKKCKCKLCSSSFVSRMCLNQHMQTHNARPNFICKVCNKSFTFRSGFKQHAKRHTESFNWVYCELCGKRFEHASNLKVHLLTHSGIKPFQCSQENCASTYTTKQCLQFHYRKHHGFTDESIPAIIRRIPFTIEAHSGGLHH